MYLRILDDGSVTFPAPSFWQKKKKEIKLINNAEQTRMIN